MRRRTMTGDRLVLYTGAQVWEGPPRIRPSRKGRYEHGPGLYFTTSLSTARKYAKGRGVVLRVEIDPRFTWLEDALLPTDGVIEWLETYPRLRRRREMIEDVLRSTKRTESRTGPGLTRASVLVNLAVNNEVLSGETGPALAEFLASHGIGASLVTNPTGRGREEDWVVLFDPSKVISWERVGPDEDEWDLPSVLR